MGRRARFKMVFFAIVALVLSLSCRRQDPLIGRWQQLGGTASAEYFSDGTALFNNSSVSLSGTWKRLEDGRLKVDMTLAGTKIIEVFQVDMQEDTATFTSSKGDVERYQRATTVMVSSKEGEAAQEKKIIRVFAGACPGEGACTFGAWAASEEVIVRRDRSEDSPIYFKIRRGERVEGITSMLEVNELGEMLVTADMAPDGERNFSLRKGQLIGTYYYLGVGYMLASLGGKDVEIPGFDCCEEKREPKTTLWLQLRNEEGKIGWTNQRDHLIGTSPHDPAVE